MKATAIIQARMGSTRLPNKVMVDIEGKPLIHRVVERVRAAECVDVVVVATPDNEENEPLLDYCRRHCHCEIYRYDGPENDVLGRYLAAATAFHAETILRVTADCPLLDPGVLNGLIRMYHANPELNFVTNNYRKSFPHGLDAEVFGIDALRTLNVLERDLSVREHCGTWRFRNDKAHFRVGNLECQKDLSGYRLTVDYEEDLTMAREIYKALKTRPVITTQDVIWLIDRRPDLRALMKATKLRFKYAATAPVVHDPEDDRLIIASIKQNVARRRNQQKG